MMFSVTAPSRIDLAGGTLDIFPLYVFEGGGSTINMAIDLETGADIEVRPDHRIVIRSEDLGEEVSYDSVDDIRPGGRLDLLSRAVAFFRPECGLNVSTRSSLPKGSGLAASSSLLVALSKGLCSVCGLEPDPHVFIDWCANIEAAHLGIPTGKQDYYAAYFGGLSRIFFGPRGIVHENVALSKLDARMMQECMVLSFTGISHFSGTNNWDMMKRYIDDVGDTRAFMRRIRDVAERMAEVIERRDVRAFAAVLGEEWSNRRGLAEGVSNDRIDFMISEAERAGAMASKLCGAGGGGCMLTVCPPESRKGVEAALENAGAKVMRFNVRFRGVEVVER